MLHAATTQRTTVQPLRSTPLRLLLVTARYFPYMGGIETHVYEVARRFAQAGIDVTVATTDPSGELPPEEMQHGVHIVRVRAWPADRDYYWAPNLYTIITCGNWDVVHIQGYHTLVAPLAMLAAWRAGIPYVVSFHSGGHSTSWRNAIRGLQQTALRPLLRHAARLVGVSQFEAAAFRKQLRLPARQFTVIPNGAHLPQVQATHVDYADGPLIVSVGRLERYKGHHRVLQAFPQVLAHYGNARLRIVGGGPYEGSLRRMADELDLAERVTIGAIPPSDREGMAGVLARAALVVLFSDYEAHPVAVMEALAVRRPVLVTHTSGLGELADRGLVRSIPLGSTTEQIAAAVVHNLEAPLVPGAVALPTWEGCAADLLALYRDVARTARRATA